MTEPLGRPVRDLSVWRDLMIAAAVAGVCALLAAHFNLHEALFKYSRRWEAMQLDELPVAIFVFSVCLVVLYARRLQQLRRALADNRQLAQRALDAQEAERKHLARELHDELGQYLNAIKLDVQSLPEGAAVGRIAQNADHVYGVVSDMIRRLRPAALDELGLEAALEACVARWRSTQSFVVIRLQTDGHLDDLGETLNLAIYRVVQESLTNCIRHASAREVEVQLHRTRSRGRDMAVLTIVDDGVGMTLPRDTSAGHGLAGMRERVHMLGGQFDVLSERGSGVTIRAEFPLQAACP